MNRPVIGLDCSLVRRTSWRLTRERLELNRWYTDAVELAGGVPVVLPVVDDPALVDEQLDLVDGLVLTGGPDLSPSLYGARKHPKTRLMLPARQVYDLELARAAVRRDIPVLGICGGLQLVNVAFGGDLVQHLPDEVGDRVPHRVEGGAYTSHEVIVQPHSRLHRILGVERLAVNSGHHQAASKVGGGLRVTARAPDGVIEALELKGDIFCVCVQWHPEILARESDANLALFRALVDAARSDAVVA